MKHLKTSHFEAQIAFFVFSVAPIIALFVRACRNSNRVVSTRTVGQEKLQKQRGDGEQTHPFDSQSLPVKLISSVWKFCGFRLKYNH